MSKKNIPREVFVRPTRYLSIHLKDNCYIAKNVLTGQERLLPIAVLTVLAAISDYMAVTKFSARIGQLFPESPLSRKVVDELLKTGILVAKDSDLDHQEHAFDSWVWSSEAAAHFLSTRRVLWMSEDKEVEAFGHLLRTKPPPVLSEDLTGENWLPLGIDVSARRCFQLLSGRRTVRRFCTTKITADELGAILSAGLGVQGFLNLPLRPTYPLTFSPSPGGLNAFVGYILARNIDGLAPGIYTYNALRNQLLKIADLPTAPLSSLFGKQRWANEAAFICVLCANYKKMAWKYSDQSAFNSLLIESGHIAQNMTVCAASLSIGSAPTNAINQEALERHLFLTFPEQALLYAVAFGREDSNRERDHYSAEILSRLESILELDSIASDTRIHS